MSPGMNDHIESERNSAEKEQQYQGQTDPLTHRRIAASAQDTHEMPVCLGSDARLQKWEKNSSTIIVLLENG